MTGLADARTASLLLVTKTTKIRKVLVSFLAEEGCRLDDDRFAAYVEALETLMSSLNNYAHMDLTAKQQERLLASGDATEFVDSFAVGKLFEHYRYFLRYFLPSKSMSLLYAGGNDLAVILSRLALYAEEGGLVSAETADYAIAVARRYGPVAQVVGEAGFVLTPRYLPEGEALIADADPYDENRFAMEDPVAIVKVGRDRVWMDFDDLPVFVPLRAASLLQPRWMLNGIDARRTTNGWVIAGSGYLYPYDINGRVDIFDDYPLSDIGDPRTRSCAALDE